MDLLVSNIVKTVYFSASRVHLALASKKTYLRVESERGGGKWTFSLENDRYFGS